MVVVEAVALAAQVAQAADVHKALRSSRAEAPALPWFRDLRVADKAVAAVADSR